LHDESRRSGYAFVVLLRDETDAMRVKGALEDLLEASPSAVVVVPPIRGADFFADAERQDQVDAWWRLSVPSAALPVYLLDEHEGVVEWVTGIDGVCYLGDRSSAVESVTDLGRSEVRRVCIRTPLDLVASVVRDFADEGGLFDAGQSAMFQKFVTELPDSADPVTDAAHRRIGAYREEIDEDNQASAAASVQVQQPFDLLAEMSAAPLFEQPRDAGGALLTQSAPVSAKLPSPAVRSIHLPSWARRVARRLESRLPSDPELAALLSGRSPTVVAVGSRKGGVGKTSHAAGVAIVAGAVLDSVGHQVAIVDANIANPDAWGQLSLPAGAATVRDVVAALASNRDPMRPVFASTPALACYPESRTSSEYSRTDIGRFAEYLRSRYTLVIVDMSNRLPDPSAGPEAAVAAFWLEQADVLVLPTASSKQDFNGVLDFLDLRGLPTTIVAYLLPRTRRNRDHPLTKRYMAAIAQRAWQVVTLPDDADGVRYAGMEGIPVQEVSTQMRAAYRALTEAIARAPKREQG
jgi:MinD-like ATPase involved in chromosome partitioning or flagellar assembly